MMLQIRNLTKTFGGITAVDNVSFDVEEKEIVGLIGPNGSGKTTLLNVISGLYKPDSGEIFFRNKQIAGLDPYKISRMGIGRVFQLVRVFKKMSALDNMITASLQLRQKKVQKTKKALELLEMVGLTHLKDELAENLSFGQQRLLEFVRVLMADPELIVLDEPLAGVNPVIVQKIINYLEEQNRKGKTILIISHNIPAICNVCRKIVVLDGGEKIAEGSPEEIQNDKKVIEAYLGV